MTTYSPFEGIRELVPVEDMPSVRTDLDIYHVWRLLLGPLGFGCRRLWVLFTDMDGRVSRDPAGRGRAAAVQPGRVRRPADHARPRPSLQLRRRSRPALLAAGPAADDRRRPELGAQSRPGGAAAEIPLWPVHFANDEELLVFAPDDLAGAARPSRSRVRNRSPG
jgi:hypothetical protein